MVLQKKSWSNILLQQIGFSTCSLVRNQVPPIYELGGCLPLDIVNFFWHNQILKPNFINYRFSINHGPGLLRSLVTSSGSDPPHGPPVPVTNLRQLRWLTQ